MGGLRSTLAGVRGVRQVAGPLCLGCVGDGQEGSLGWFCCPEVNAGAQDVTFPLSLANGAHKAGAAGRGEATHSHSGAARLPLHCQRRTAGFCWLLIFECHRGNFLKILGTSLVVQWLRLCTSNAGGMGAIPGQGTRCCMSWGVAILLGINAYELIQPPASVWLLLPC